MLFGPVAQLYGRRWVMVNCALLFCAFSVATAVAPDLVSYYIFRICTAIQGTAFLVVGPACISDIFRPQERATAVSWFLSGTTVAPALAPFIGGVIVTYRSWRDIFWLQAALGGLAAVLLLFFLPETLPEDSKNGLVGFGKHARAILKAANPLRVFTTMYEYPSIFFVSMASSAVMWNQYSVLTPIRYVINPRFHLTSPAQSGLVYLVPGCGNLIGTFFGGRFADRYVKLYLKKKGRRVPEDRLRSCTWSMGLIIPACLVVYGWTITKEVGGMPVPLVALFVLGFFQMICIPSLNTYCLDVLQEQGRTADALSCNYFPRYIAAAVGTAVVIPAVQGIGLGWFCVITAAILVVTTFSVLLAIWKGEAWRATREGAIVLEN
ncbi:hypothetical protein KEM55_008730 [Ascosphaera atra]|nr:hypothetical protein KEM55_008730 [Ascosphaera atra]